MTQELEARPGGETVDVAVENGQVNVKRAAAGAEEAGGEAVDEAGYELVGTAK